MSQNVCSNCGQYLTSNHACGTKTLVKPAVPDQELSDVERFCRRVEGGSIYADMIEAISLLRQQEQQIADFETRANSSHDAAKTAIKYQRQAEAERDRLQAECERLKTLGEDNAGWRFPCDPPATGTKVWIIRKDGMQFPIEWNEKTVSTKYLDGELWAWRALPTPPPKP